MSLIARLVECGAPADVIEEVALLVAEKRALDQRRMHERERKRRSRDVTGQDVTSQDSEIKRSPHTPLKDIPPVSPKGDTAPQGAKRSGFKIPDDWEPPVVADLGPKFRALAEQWTQASYETEAAAFHAYWQAETGAKASKSNWKRAWENRVAQIHSKVMRDQKFGNAAPASPQPQRKALTDQDWLEKYEEKARWAREQGLSTLVRDYEAKAAEMRVKLGVPVPGLRAVN